MQVTTTYGTATHHDPTAPPPYAKHGVAYDHKTPAAAGYSTYQPMPPHVPTNDHMTPSATPSEPSIIPPSPTLSHNQLVYPDDPPPYQE